MIDLSKQSDQTEKWLDENIQRFLKEFPEQLPISIGLYSSPASGWVSLCIDVSGNFAAPATNCPDFSHPKYGLMEFPEWRNEYESESPILKRHDGKMVRFNHAQGDAIFNRNFFEFLMRIINDYYHGQKSIFRPVWIGVQMVNGGGWSFGRVYQPKTVVEPLN